MVGIVSYGFYIPRYRIKTATIAAVWGACGDKIENSLLIEEKAVSGLDEDMFTMAYEAAAQACEGHEDLKAQIGAVFIGSETFPYAVKPMSTSLAQWLSLGHDYLAYDTQFACKAGTGAFLSAASLIKSQDIDYALVCASDKANAKPHDALEYSAASGANAWLLGGENVAAELVGWHSYSSDTPDFYRRAKADYPSHAGRFTGGPAYFKHISEASKRLLSKISMKPSDFAHAVFHMPNGAFPLKIGKALGFEKQQLQVGHISPKLGNSYAASALMGLCAVLEKAQPGEYIFFASYGSGAASDAMVFRITEHITSARRQFSKSIKDVSYIDYVTYMKYMNMITL